MTDKNTLDLSNPETIEDIPSIVPAIIPCSDMFLFLRFGGHIMEVFIQLDYLNLSIIVTL